MTNSSFLKVHFITTNGTDTHHVIKQFLNIFYTQYGYDERELFIGKRCFLIVTHFQYGMVGGLCLSPPNSHPPLHIEQTRIIEFFQDLNKCWVGSHLFFYLPEKIEDRLSDTQLMHLHSSIFKAFYHKLIYLSLAWKLPELRLLIDQEQYANVNCGILPYLSERHLGLDGQAYVLSHLSLPPFSYAFFHGLLNKFENFDDQLLSQMLEEQQFMNDHFQSAVDVSHANNILH